MDISNLFRTAKRRYPALPIARQRMDGEDVLLLGTVSVRRELRDRQIRSCNGIRTVEEAIYIVGKDPDGVWEVGCDADPIKALGHAVRVFNGL